MNWRILRWQIAEITGWSLEHIDEMNAQDVADWLAYHEGMNKAEK